MRNVLSDNMMKTLAASDAGRTGITEEDFEKDSPKINVINLQYERAFQAVLANQPWTFATKREDLIQSSEIPNKSSPYQFLFDLPADIFKVWDIYRSELYDGLYRSDLYNTFPSTLGEGVVPGLGEIIRGSDGLLKVASSCRLAIFYTIRDNLDFKNYSPEFVEILMATLTGLLEKSKELPPDQMEARYNVAQREIAGHKRNAALENRKALNIAPPTLVTSIKRKLGQSPGRYSRYRPY